MEKLLVFSFSFMAIYLLYLFTVVLRKNKREKYKKSAQVLFFVKKYNLDFDKVSVTKFANILALSNSFVMATAMLVQEFANNFLLKMLFILITLLPIIYLEQLLIGFYIKKKVGK